MTQNRDCRYHEGREWLLLFPDQGRTQAWTQRAARRGSPVVPADSFVFDSIMIVTNTACSRRDPANHVTAKDIENDIQIEMRPLCA